MITAKIIGETRRHVRAARAAGKSIGFVPTMGALHRGHWALVEMARKQNDYVVVSIYVNPIQFAPGEDFERYPRSLPDDLRGCAERGVDLVFTPDSGTMYPDDAATRVVVTELTAPLCGRFRTGHFDGVTTVVAKLFNIVAPDAAFFGEKDYQQLLVIRRMARDLDLPVEIVACPTVREEDGLACSSRNAYLSSTHRVQAASLYRALQEAAQAVRRGQTDAASLIESMRRTILEAGPAEIDYVSIVDPESLRDVVVVDRPVRICLAAHLGGCRLIDNLSVDPAAGTP